MRRIFTERMIFMLKYDGFKSGVIKGKVFCLLRGHGGIQDQ